ncbi:MAG TPA: hypothetical protein VGL94_13230 [Ktedonobacteraceae bacterium]
MTGTPAMAAGPSDNNNYTLYTGGLCEGFSNQEAPPEWRDIVCNNGNPIENPDQTFTQQSGNGPCQPNWVKITTQTGQIQCTLTLPHAKGGCPIGFTLDDARCEYVPQNSGRWQVGFCKPFTSNEVPLEWISTHICDINPIPDPQRSFIKDGPCKQNWIRTVAEGGNQPKCILSVPTTKDLCPIGFALDGASCNYVPQVTTGWQFPCSDQPDGKPNEKAIARDWLSGNSSRTEGISSDPDTNDSTTTGGRFEHTFAADTYGLQSIQEVFSYMLALAFVLVTPMLILIGYQMLLAVSCIRYAGALEGLSRVMFGIVAVGVSFQLVTMLISSANVIGGALIDLHGVLGYPPERGPRMCLQVLRSLLPHIGA